MRTFLVALLAASAVLALVGAAAAAELSRAEYVERVEPICRANTEANEKILAGVRAKVRSGKLKPASRQVAAAARALQRTWRQLKTVPQPEADEPRLHKWLTTIRSEVVLFEEVARKLARNQKAAAQKLVVRLLSNAQQANNQVLIFEFRYCHLQPSKFL